MRSLKFPKMFNTNSTNVWKSNEYLESTKQNTFILLQCEKGELFCDPDWGILLKKYLFDQNSYKLKDIIIDTIYQQVALMIPQLKISRSDIQIVQDKEKGKLYCTFTALNQIDYKVNTYQLILFDSSEAENF